MELSDRVVIRMKKLGLTPSSLARILTGNGYKTNQSTIQQLTSGKTKTFRRMSELASALQTNVAWLITGFGNEESESSKSVLKDSTAGGREEIQFGHDMIPVVGVANGSSEAVLLNLDQEIGRVLRHTNQANVKRAFAVKVYGESMSPRFRHGELAFINGDMPPTKGQDCLVEMNDGTAYIKIFIKRTDKEIICEQINPSKQFKRPLKDIKAIHAIVGRG